MATYVKYIVKTTTVGKWHTATCHLLGGLHPETVKVPVLPALPEDDSARLAVITLLTGNGCGEPAFVFRCNAGPESRFAKGHPTYWTAEY